LPLKSCKKQVGLLRELVPDASVLGFLVNPDSPRAPADVSRVREAARGLGLETHVVNARTERDLDAAFASLLRQHADALLIGGDALFSRASTTVATLATRHAGSAQAASAGAGSGVLQSTAALSGGDGGMCDGALLVAGVERVGP
jgi:hypothetical protein